MGRNAERRAIKKARRYAQNKKQFDILSYTFRWTGQEIAWLYFSQIKKIKDLIKRTPFKGPTTVYKQSTVDAYWDELMNRMPEGREPEVKPIADDEPQNLQKSN